MWQIITLTTNITSGHAFDRLLSSFERNSTKNVSTLIIIIIKLWRWETITNQ